MMALFVLAKRECLPLEYGGDIVSDNIQLTQLATGAHSHVEGLGYDGLVHPR